MMRVSSTGRRLSFYSSILIIVLGISIIQLEENNASYPTVVAFQTPMMVPSFQRSIRNDDTHWEVEDCRTNKGRLLLFMSKKEEDGGSSSSSVGGDKMRASTGIRPSLHPTTINAISQALLLRSNKNKETPMEVTGDVEPLEVAMAAGNLAAVALKNRAVSCQADGDDESRPREDECQTVAGRVVGVVMRFPELEQRLVDVVKEVPWVLKYQEESSFGLLRNELVTSAQNDMEDKLSQRIRDDPLFRMCRAECLFALFLQKIELPSLTDSGHSVPGGSFVDFIDQDRLEVLFPDLN